jgi:hypothetical protein
LHLGRAIYGIVGRMLQDGLHGVMMISAARRLRR